MKLISITLAIAIGIGVLISCKTDPDPSITYHEYYRSYNKVSDFLKNGEYKKAVMLFDSIEDKVPHVPSAHLFRLARESAYFGYCDSASKYLERSFENGEEYGKGFDRNVRIRGCWGIVDSIMKMEDEIHGRNFNYRYKHMIDSMFAFDQGSRMDTTFENVHVIDSLNMISLLSLIDKYGFPSEKIIGERSSFNAYIIMLHMDRDTNNRIFKPILDQAYHNGFLSPISLAWITDRRLSWGPDNLEPYYYHMPSKKYDLFVKEQRDVIDQRRDSIGLRPK